METEVINVVEKPIDDFEKSTDFYPLPPFLAYTKSGEVEVTCYYESTFGVFLQNCFLKCTRTTVRKLLKRHFTLQACI